MTIEEICTLPPRKLFRELVRRTFEHELKVGLDNLTAEQRHLCFAAALHGETMNGGLSQYFTNSAGKDYKLALVALRIIGANRQEALVLKWLEQLPPSVRPEIPNEVGRCVFSTPTLTKALEGIDQQYFDSAEAFYQVMADYVKAHARAFEITQ